MTSPRTSAEQGSEIIPEFVGLIRAHDIIRSSELEDDYQLGVFADIVGLEQGYYGAARRRLSPLIESKDAFRNKQAAALYGSALDIEAEGISTRLMLDTENINNYLGQRPGLLVADSFGLVRGDPVYNRLAVSGLKIAALKTRELPRTIVMFESNHSSETREIRSVKCRIASFLPKEKEIIQEGLVAYWA